MSHNQAVTDENLLINFDWIEFTARQTSFTDLNFCDKDLKLVPLDMGTQYFKQRIEIFCNSGHEKGEQIANLEVSPRVSFIPCEVVKIKMMNWCCYSERLYEFIRQINELLHLQFINYTRLDVCFDFQKIVGYKSVQSFLSKVAEDKIWMKGVVTEVFINNGIKSYQIETDVNLFRDRGGITGVSFGKRISGIKTTIYNKTKELRRKKDKPYIREAWKKAGFDVNDDVYRLEYSTSKNRTEILSNEGETLGDYTEMDFIQKLPEYGNYLLENHKMYKRYGKKKVGFRLLDRRGKSMFKRVYSLIKKVGNNAHKCLAKYLTFEILFNRTTKKDDPITATSCYNLLQDMLTRWNLKSWWRKVFPDFEAASSNYTPLDLMTSDKLKDFTLLNFSYPQKRMNVII